MKSRIGTLLLTFVVFLFSIEGNSAMDRSIKREESQGSSNSGYNIHRVRKGKPYAESNIYITQPHPPHRYHHLRLGGNSAVNRPITQNEERESSPDSQESSNRAYIRVVPKHVVAKIEPRPREEPSEPQMYEARYLHHPNHLLRPIKLEPQEFPRYRDPAHAHLDIDLNKLPPEAYDNPHHQFY